MGKKKKNSVNGFSLFLKDFRKREEQKGRHFEDNKEASDAAGQVWTVMSDDEKNSYVTKAARIKGCNKDNLANKFTSLGVSYEELENERLRKLEEENIMAAYLRNLFKSLNYETDFLTKSFFVIHVNYFYKNNENSFKPAEIALVEFNLKRGVLSKFHRFVDSGKIEIGFRSAALEMYNIHGIPIEDPNWDKGENNYVQLLGDIMRFMRNGIEDGRLPPLYTMPNNVNQYTSYDAVVSVITRLCEAKEEDPEIFRFYPLPNLFHEMRQKAINDSGYTVDIKYLTIAMAMRDIEKDPFQYAKNIACQYHEDKDLGSNCSLSFVTRWVYTICNQMLTFTPDNVVPDGHVPQDSHAAWKSTRPGSSAMKNSKVYSPKLDSVPSTGTSSESNYSASIKNESNATTSKKPLIVAPSTWSAGKLANAPKAESNRSNPAVTSRSTSCSAYSSLANPTVNHKSHEYPQPQSSTAPLSSATGYTVKWPPLGRGVGRGIFNSASIENSEPNRTFNWAPGGGRGALLRRQLGYDQ